MSLMFRLDAMYREMNEWGMRRRVDSPCLHASSRHLLHAAFVIFFCAITDPSFSFKLLVPNLAKDLFFVLLALDVTENRIHMFKNNRETLLPIS